MFASACKTVCVSTCEGACALESINSVVLQSLNVDLNQPSLELFAQDMPQEVKTTAHVCPGSRAFHNTLNSCNL